MTDLFYTSPESIGSLLESIDKGKTVLPGFQRRFSWDTQRQRALVRTILNSYPAGSMLFLQYPKRTKLGRRLIDGVDPVKDSSHPERIILDGQQRLTTLYNMLFGKHGSSSIRGFIEMQIVNQFLNHDGRLPDSNEKRGIDLVESAIRFIYPAAAKTQYGDLQNQFDQHTIPLTTVFEKEEVTMQDRKHQMGFDAWKAQYVEYHEPDDKNKRLALNSKLEEIGRRFISPIKDYQFPVVVLQEKTEPHAVCQVFVDLNIQQKPLSPFEVAAAKVWPFEIDLYKEWEEARRIRAIRDFDIGPVLPLKVISLIQTNEDDTQRLSCGKKALYRLKPDNFQDLWGRAVGAIDWSLRLLKAECGVLHKKWLPYSSLLVSMAATLIHLEDMNLQKEQEEVKRKLTCWYWCSVFAETYSRGTDSQNARDFGGLQLWMKDEGSPFTVRYFSSIFNPEILLNTYSGGRYRGIICLLLRNHARDFRTTQAISTSLILNEEINDHHIFPDEFLKSSLGVEDWSIRNCIVNRALVDRQTNQDIGFNAPSKYLQDITKRIEMDSLREILESQFIPNDLSGGLFNDNYDKFLKERMEMLTKEIVKVTNPPWLSHAEEKRYARAQTA